jgi:type IV pilus assembly protein PilV
MKAPAHQHGVGLVEAMVALAILAFGMLGMMRMQARLVAQGTESQNRIVATQITDQLFAMAIVDPDHASCYTHGPVASDCPEANPARTATSNWAAEAAARLPGFKSATSALNAGRLTVTLTWTGKSVQESQRPDSHQVVITSDVRP